MSKQLCISLFLKMKYDLERELKPHDEILGEYKVYDYK